MIRLLAKLHRRLLPARPEVGWTPYVWLFYLSFFLWRWIQQPPGAGELALGVLALAAFLVLYFNGYWHSGARLSMNMAGIVAIGLLLTPVNPGAMVFFIYAAGFSGFLGPPRLGWLSLVSISVSVLFAAWFFAMPWFWTLITLSITVMIGGVNIYFAEVGRKNEALRRSQEEVERLASVAERERIARDLHDLLGHTLTTITVKAELARRLSERGDGRARDEIADVERISREALAQVREAVAGFADVGLAGELARARLVCEARGIELDGEIVPHQELALDARRETALAMVLREAVTNAVRHSGAACCRIRLERRAASAVLTVEDDGRGGRGEAGGHGLRSMRERLERLGGELDVEKKLGPQGGFRVTARLPAERAAAEELTHGVRPLPEPA